MKECALLTARDALRAPRDALRAARDALFSRSPLVRSLAAHSLALTLASFAGGEGTQDNAVSGQAESEQHEHTEAKQAQAACRQEEEEEGAAQHSLRLLHGRLGDRLGLLWQLRVHWPLLPRRDPGPAGVLPRRHRHRIVPRSHAVHRRVRRELLHRLGSPVSAPDDNARLRHSLAHILPGHQADSQHHRGRRYDAAGDVLHWVSAELLGQGQDAGHVRTDEDVGGCKTR